MNRRSFFRLAALPMAAAVIPVQGADAARPAAFDRLVRGIDYGPRESTAMFMLLERSGHIVDVIEWPVSIRQRAGGAEVLANDVTFRSIDCSMTFAAAVEAWGIRVPGWNIDYVTPLDQAIPIVSTDGRREVNDITLQFRDRVALRLA